MLIINNHTNDDNVPHVAGPRGCNASGHRLGLSTAPLPSPHPHDHPSPSTRHIVCLLAVFYVRGNEMARWLLQETNGGKGALQLTCCTCPSPRCASAENRRRLKAATVIVTLRARRGSMGPKRLLAVARLGTPLPAAMLGTPPLASA